MTIVKSKKLYKMEAWLAVIRLLVQPRYNCTYHTYLLHNGIHTVVNTLVSM